MELTRRGRRAAPTRSSQLRAVATRKWRVGLVGAGYVSRYHLLGLKKLANVEIVGVADLDQQRTTRAMQQLGARAGFRTLDEMVATARPEVVHVLTPPGSHCAVALEALELGCHVLVEKPMALSIEECERMIAAAARRQRVLSVNHSARFDPALLKGLAAATAGRIGTVLAIEYIRSSEYPPFSGGVIPEYYRAGGYPFRDLGVHALYVAEAFLGEIREAEGWFGASGLQPHLKFDEWQARVSCARGMANVYLSWNSRPMQNTIIVHGTAGRLIIDSFVETCTIERALPGDKTISLMWNGTVGALLRAAGVSVNALRFALGRLERAPDIQRSIAEFYAALSAGSPPPVSAEEGRRIVGWLEEIARPADEAGRRMRASDRRPATILVTGGTGFLGRRLVQALLDRGETVRLLVRRPPATLSTHPRLRIVYGDLGEPEAVDAAVEGVAAIFHVGAATRGGAEDYQCGTIGGTHNVVEAALRQKVRKLVYVSSLSVLDYAHTAGGTRVNEHSALERYPKRRGLYPNAKLQAERIVLDGVARGLDATLLRPGQIFGPGAEHTAPYGVFAVGGGWLVLGSGRMELPLVYVDDVVDALLQAAEANLNGRIFHLVDSEKITQRQYIDACRHMMPELAVRYVPMAAAYCAAAALAIPATMLGIALPLTIYRLRSLKGHLHFDCEAAARELGWRPRTGVAQGMRITFGGAQDGIEAEPRRLGA